MFILDMVIHFIFPDFNEHQLLMKNVYSLQNPYNYENYHKNAIENSCQIYNTGITSDYDIALSNLNMNHFRNASIRINQKGPIDLTLNCKETFDYDTSAHCATASKIYVSKYRGMLFFWYYDSSNIDSSNIYPIPMLMGSQPTSLVKHFLNIQQDSINSLKNLKIDGTWNDMVTNSDQLINFPVRNIDYPNTIVEDMTTYIYNARQGMTNTKQTNNHKYLFPTHLFNNTSI